MSTSPPCEAGRSRRLTGAIVPCAQLPAGDRARMYALLEAHFAGTDRARFEMDLVEKEAAILLRSDDGRIEGFSTFMRMAVELDDEPIVAFFSGDTIVDRRYWGETALTRTWGEAVFAEAVRLRCERPGVRAYWFLICSGYKTWRFLPVFFREFHPNPAGPTPVRVQRLLDTLGARKFGREYTPGAGIVRFRHATPLRRGIADVTEARLRDPHVAFFVRVNPGHAEGDELACLAELSPANLTRAGARIAASL
jgi:hypothetical protein